MTPPRILTALVFLALAGLLPAQEEQNAADEAFRRLRQGTTDLQTLAEVLPGLADPERRAEIRAAVIGTDEPPREELAALLDHPLLAVRLGSLELLEEMAGGDFSYNPWNPAESPENAGSLALWRQWAGEPTEREPGTGLFTEEERAGYLRDLLGEDRDKATRARRMLEAEGLPAVGFLETFLQSTATLGPGHRARVREAQYQITLSRQLGDQAATTARHLAFGSRDQLLTALGSVRGAGLLALPILRDFIDHPDPLVRETAIDSLLVTGGQPAVEIVAPILRAEPDVNVIHGALRRLKDVPGSEAAELAASFIDRDDEDLRVSAIQTCLSLSGDAGDLDFGNRRTTTSGKSPADEKVIAALDDPRWRVRAAALEYVTKRRLTAAKDASIAALSDPDEFVRFAAIGAIGSLGATEALPKLEEMFAADPSMAGPVMAGYGALNRRPDADLLARLDTAPPEAKLAALQATESHSVLSQLPLRYAVDENLDVACAALRLIASDSDSPEKQEPASALVVALRSGVPAKVEAVMERLRLPAVSNPALLAALDEPLVESGPTALDPLYDAFLLPGAEAGPKPDAIPGATDALVQELVALAGSETPDSVRFQAAVNLARGSHPKGFAVLGEMLPALTTAQKIAAADALDEPATPEALEFLGKLLRDEVAEVRSSAASAALSSGDSRACVMLVLGELTREGTPLQANEVYDYRFESMVRAQRSAPFFRDWCLGVIASDAAVPLRVLAVIGSRESQHPTVVAALEKAASAPEPLVRRAAWSALLALRPAELPARAETIAGDPEAFVREALPARAGDSDNAWQHRFSDLHVVRDARWTYNETKPRVDEPTRAILSRLAREDPSPVIRFEAGFALLTLGEAIDVEAFATLVPTLPKDLAAPRRVTAWLGENASRAGPGLRPLLAIVDPSAIRPQQLQELGRRLNPSRDEAGFATFASLADVAIAGDDADQPLLDEAEDEAPDVERESLAVIYFYKPGCPECIRAKHYLDAVRESFPLMQVHEHNILDAGGTVLNQALCERFAVPSAQHTLSPAVFTQAGFLIRDELSPIALARLFGETMTLPQDDTWMELGETEIAAAAEVVDRRYQALTLPVVIAAGLLDGINPCAFATIIFFLSYLQIARRTPKEMLMVGAAFISAVFIAYLAAGLLLYNVLAALNDRFAGIQLWLNYGFASLALVAAVLSFRDAWRARGGRLDEMTLQLPAFLKDRIRGVIRTGARARRFVIAAFISGLVISLLELACTGQVYAPIIYQIQQGRLDAVLWLVTYNLAFIAPLVGIFLLAYGGLRSETLVRFQKRHTSSVKTALGVLFVVLAALILFGGKLLAGS